MHATNVSEEDQRFTSMKRSLQALHFFRQPRLDVLVGKRILHVCVGMTLIEQEGQKEGGEKNRARGLHLESSLHGTCEVVQNVITKPFTGYLNNAGGTKKYHCGRGIQPLQRR
jgi:hypothetical protein